MRLWVLLLYALWARRVASLHIHGNTVHLLPRLPKEREGSLWVLQSHVIPPKVHGFLGRHTYIVSSLKGVESGNVSELHPEHKYSPSIDSSEGISVRVVDSGVRLPLRGKIINKHKVFFEGPVSLAKIRRIAESTNVLSIEPARSTLLPHSPPNPREEMLGPGYLLPPYGAGINIMVSDSGLDTTHCYFYALNATPQAVEYAPGMFTNPAVYNNSHGSKSAGVALGRTCQTEMGVANESGLLFIDLTLTPGVLVLPMDWAPVYSQAVSKNISLHSISWGLNSTEFGVYDLLASEIDAFTYNTGILPCVAGGNLGPAQFVSSPATGKNLLSVAACTGNTSLIASFSSMGVRDGRVHVPLVAALGYDVVVAESQTPAAPNHATFTIDQGTSLSAPAICGLAALVDQHCLVTTGKICSAALKMAAVVNCAVPTSGVVDVNTSMILPGYHDLSFGVPFLNLSAALYLDHLVTTGSSYTVCFAATGPSVAATLAWIDPPAIPYSSSVLVNDLDLLIVYNGVEFIAPTVQNVERIILNTVVGATIELTVFVQGYLSTPNQTFALALSGVKTQECGVIPCYVPFGSGLLAGSSCIVIDCVPFYFISNNMCVCQATKDCGNSVLVECNHASNTFPACPESHIVIVDEDAPALAVTIIMGIVVWLSFIVCIALACTKLRDVEMPRMPEAPAWMRRKPRPPPPEHPLTEPLAPPPKVPMKVFKRTVMGGVRWR